MYVQKEREWAYRDQSCWAVSSGQNIKELELSQPSLLSCGRCRNYVRERNIFARLFSLGSLSKERRGCVQISGLERLIRAQNDSINIWKFLCKNISHVKKQRKNFPRRLPKAKERSKRNRYDRPSKHVCLACEKMSHYHKNLVFRKIYWPSMSNSTGNYRRKEKSWNSKRWNTRAQNRRRLDIDRQIDSQTSKLLLKKDVFLLSKSRQEPSWAKVIKHNNLDDLTDHSLVLLSLIKKMVLIQWPTKIDSIRQLWYY